MLCASKRLVLWTVTRWLILFVGALVPAFASNIEIGSMAVTRTCNSAGVQLCSGTVVVFNEMENFLMVNVSFNVGANSFSSIPPQTIFEREAVAVLDQGGVDEYRLLHGLTLLSVSGQLGGVSAPPLTFVTPAGTFTASSDNWMSPQFQANFSGTLGIFVSATPVTNTPEPSTGGLMLVVIGLSSVMCRCIWRAASHVRIGSFH